jgi:hypothetical protein
MTLSQSANQTGQVNFILTQESLQSPKNEMDYLLLNMHYIVKLQAWVRGNKARRQTEIIKSKQIGSNKYFTFAEFKETATD